MKRRNTNNSGVLPPEQEVTRSSEEEEGSASKRTSDPSPAASLENTIDSVSPYPSDTFLSHNWGKDGKGRDNHARVLVMDQALKREGLTTWIDEEKMQGDIDQRMSCAIEESLTVIVFVTKKYIEKVNSRGNDNCKFEFGHAKQHRSVENMIPVVMEDIPTPWPGPVGMALGNHLYYSYKTDDELDQCVEALVAQIHKRKKEYSGTPSRSPGSSAVTNAQSQTAVPERKNENVHACFILPQPSSAAPSSQFKLRVDLNYTKEHIEKEGLNGLKCILYGGSGKDIGTRLRTPSCSSSPDRPMIQTKICFIAGDGIDESSLPSYLDQIVEMKPKMVVVCMRYGAKRVGDYLAERGVDIVFWTRFDINGIDRHHLFEDLWLPICQDLLVKGASARESWEKFQTSINKTLQSNGRKPISIDGSWCDTIGEVDDSATHEVDARPGKGSVEVRTSDLGRAKMFGFDDKDFSSYRASHLQWTEQLKVKVHRRQDLRRSRGMQFLHMKIKAGDAYAAHDLMLLLCICAVDDEMLGISGVYSVMDKRSKAELIDKIPQKRNVVVWLDSIKNLFPSPEDLVDWLQNFKGRLVTFLIASDTNNNNEHYVNAIEKFHPQASIKDFVVWDSSVSTCEMTKYSRCQNSLYQGTIKVLPPEHIHDRQFISKLKETIATLVDQTPERIQVFQDDDGSILIHVGIKNVQQLKAVFHNLLDGTLKK